MPVIPKDSVENTLSSLPAIGDAWVQSLGRSGGLTQFGVNLETLPPGSRSSIKHWHEKEDEFVYLLSGQVDLHEGDAITPMQPGDAAAFPAGAPLGHCLVNNSEADAQILVIGTRAPQDVVTYPDDDCVLTSDRQAGIRSWTRADGTPRSNPYDAPAK